MPQGIQVAHALRPNFGFDGINPAPVYPDGFITVAVVEVPEGTEATPDLAFRLTNHIDSPWWENPGVTLVGSPTHRSTSVGDVVVMPDGSVMKCEMAGWSKVA